MVVLCNVLGNTKDHTPAMTPLIVEHQTTSSELKAKELDELVISPKHVNTIGSAENDVGDLGFRLTSLSYGFDSNSFSQHRHLNCEYILTSVK